MGSSVDVATRISSGRLLEAQPGSNAGSLSSVFFTNRSLAFGLAVLVCATLVVAWSGCTWIEDASRLPVWNKPLASLVFLTIIVRFAIKGWLANIAGATHLFDPTL